ncbi:hypothetical protein [Wukongibacter sp. M2B1]|uniref:hypothetical protein n=1 Tax=Wukongibacter sp. M2B1 TaxID=3088895 RepID=UPI003D7B7D1F
MIIITGRDIRNAPHDGIEMILDSEVYLKYDFNALVEIEKTYGSIEKGNIALQEGSLESILYFFYVGLLHEDKHVVFEELLSKIETSNLVEISKAITEALYFSMPEIQEMDEKAIDNSKQDSENNNDNSEWNWAWLFYLGTNILNMTETEFWRCTPRKLFSLWEIHKEVNQLNKSNKDNTKEGYIDDVIW